MKNVFFFFNINVIGGVETFFYELAKKYHETHDITVYYVKADERQLKRLRRLVRCIQYKGEEVECENAFFNYNLEPLISHIHAKHVYEIIHADFKLQKNIKPHVDPRIDTYLAVSKRVAESFESLTGVRCEVCPNPLLLEPIDHPPLFLCIAQRMTSEKGVERIKALVNRLDADKEIKYYMLAFTTDNKFTASPNVAMMPTRLDIRPFIYGCDIFIAVSDSEGRCYSVGEKLGYGTGKLLITPCPSFFEQGADEGNSIVLNFDMSNMDDVIEQIRKVFHAKRMKKGFEPIEAVDIWDRYLADGKPDYEGLKYYRVRTTELYLKDNIYDVELKCVPRPNVEMTVDGIRLKKLLEYPTGHLVEVIEEIGRT